MVVAEFGDDPGQQGRYGRGVAFLHLSAEAFGLDALPTASSAIGRHVTAAVRAMLAGMAQRVTLGQLAWL